VVTILPDAKLQGVDIGRFMSAETTTGKLIANLPRADDSIGEKRPILRQAVGEICYGTSVFFYSITSHRNKIWLASWATERMCLTSSPVL
jgi:hypothetical protein